MATVRSFGCTAPIVAIAAVRGNGTNEGRVARVPLRGQRVRRFTSLESEILADGTRPRTSEPKADDQSDGKSKNRWKESQGL